MVESSTNNGKSLHPKRVLSSLFHHSSPSPKPVSSRHSVAEDSVDHVQAIISKWDPNSSSYTKLTSLFRHSREEAHDFVAAVKALRRAMDGLVTESSSSVKLVLAQKLMQTAMHRLEKEFFQILSENRDSLDPESISGGSSSSSGDGKEDDSETVNESLTKIERVSALAMSDLKSIADCMITCGYSKECLKIYTVIRKSIVDEGMYRVRIERFRSSHVHKLSWDALAATVTTWLNAANIAVRTVFNGEKSLCDHVFSSSETIRDSCFHDITKEAATNLFRFPELVAKSKKSSPERIFRLMELYEAFSDLWPEIESIFSSEVTSDIRSQALSSSLKLRDTIHSILLDFEAAIQKDFSSKTPVAGGGIHPMTRSVMEYISTLADHAGVLAEYPLPHGSSQSFIGSPANSPDAASVHLAWLILVLLCKLDSKGELYKDASLSYLFMANNLQYIVEKVRTTSLKLILRDDWISMHEKKVTQYASNYESLAWTKVFLALPHSQSPLPPDLARQSFTQFSVAFEEAHRKHSSLIVPDGRLRDELKESISKKLVPKYMEFYDANVAVMSEDSAARFSPDDVGNYLSGLFHGFSMSATSSSSSSPSLAPHRCLSR